MNGHITLVFREIPTYAQVGSAAIVQMSMMFEVLMRLGLAHRALKAEEAGE